MKTIFTFLFVSLALISQAQRKTKSTLCKATVYENKDFVKKDFKKLIVKSSLTDPKNDQRLIAEFDELKLPMVSWLTLFPPVKEYSDSDIDQTLTANGIDGILVLENKGDASKTYLGTTYKSVNYELYLMDATTKNKTIVFVGNSELGAMSSLAAPDKTAIKFARNSVRDIGSYLKQ